MKLQKAGKMVGKTLNQGLKFLSKLGNAVVMNGWAEEVREKRV